MIEKELKRLSDDIPEIDIDSVKKGIYKKQNTNKKRKNLSINFMKALKTAIAVTIIFVFLVIGGFILNDEINHQSPSDPSIPANPSNPTEPLDPENPSKPKEPLDPENPSDPKEPFNPSAPQSPLFYSTSDKGFYMDKFVENIFEEEIPDGPYRESFLEFDRSWYRLQAAPVTEYICLYLDKDVYEFMIDAIFDDCCTYFKEVVDGEEYIYLYFNRISRSDLINISKVDGTIANLYFELLSSRSFKIEDEYLTLQEYAQYLGKDIIIDEDNYIVKQSNYIDELTLTNNEYIAMAYLFYQRINYTFNYIENSQINYSDAFYGSMVAFENSNLNVYYNAFDSSKEYLYMDVPLEFNVGCEKIPELKYNLNGEKEYIAFEIYNIDGNEYINLDENKDISTINLLSSGDNYDCLFNEKIQVDNNEYYLLSELIKVNNELKVIWEDILMYNSIQRSNSWHALTDLVPDTLDEEFNVNISNDGITDTITSGMVIYETTKNVTDIKYTLLQSGDTKYAYTTVQIDQFNVCLRFEVLDEGLWPSELIELEWIKEGDINKLVITYSENLIGKSLRVWTLFDQDLFFYTYTSYYGVFMKEYSSFSYYEPFYVYIG